MPALNEPRPARATSLPGQADALATVLREEFGAPFRVFDANTGGPLAPGESAAYALAPEDAAWVVRFGAEPQTGVFPRGESGYRLALSIHQDGRPALVALGVKGSVARPSPEAVHEETVRLERWLRAVLERLLTVTQAGCRHRGEPAKPAPGADAWEVVARLDQLMRTQKVHKDPYKNRKRVLRSAAELVKAQALVFVPTRSDDPVVAQGEGLLSTWDCSQLATTLAKSVDWEESGYFIRNDVGTSSWSLRFPQVANLLAVPVLDRAPVGWLIAINKKAGFAPTNSDPAPGAEGARGGDARGGESAPVAPFRKTDAALLSPFASLLGYHARASQSYNQLRELLVGLTRSLTAAIDAKDSYTFGHSERVARIAVELGRELGLQEDELSDVYLAGLLHDIGKIGIRDDVLRKSGALDPAEFEHIKEHVKIGHRILSGLRAIAHLLPGVLYHHERYDGQGYPEGLKGNAIPFIARILAVADSYDAMSTSRPYRVAMPCERVEQVLREGSNQQWEKAVVDAFFRCKDRIHAIRQRGVGDSLCGALDDALRKGAGRQPLSSVVSIVVD